MKQFCDWLYGTQLSHLFQTVRWIIPVTQCVHIVCLSILFTSMIMLDLRLIGLAGRRHSVEFTANRFLPLLWRVLPIMLASGLVLIIAEPSRDLLNVAFYTKMALVLTACTVNYAIQLGVRSNPAAWESAGTRRRTGQILGAACLLFWIGIVVSGRLIAYV